MSIEVVHASFSSGLRAASAAGLRSPSRTSVPGGGGLPGHRRGAWVSSTDMAPTLLDLAGVPWKGREAEGRSLVPLLRQESTDTVPVYAERGTSTALIIHHDLKYLLNPARDFSGCLPYEEGGGSYVAPPHALWDLKADPRELRNLSGRGHPEEAELRQRLCDWVTLPGWADGGGPTTTLRDDCAGG